MPVDEYMETVTYPLSLLSTPVWLFDVERLKVLWANAAGLVLWDASSLAELQQRDMADGISRKVRERLCQYCDDLAGSTSSAMEHWTFYPRGRPSSYECSISVIETPSDTHWLLVNAMRQDTRSDSDTLYRSSALLHTSVSVSVFDRDGMLKYTNPAARRMLGSETLSLAERFVDEQDWRQVSAELSQYAKASIEARMLTASGAVWHNLQLDLCPDPISGCSSILISETDISDRHEAQLLVHQLAYSDTLTGLPNRTSWLNRLQARLKTAEEKQNRLGILFVDLDRFKLINDTLGHALGDQLLIEVASRLNSCLDDDHYLARLGGDEFTLLLDETDNGGQSLVMARKIIDALGTPMHVDGHILSITPSIGISLYPQQGADANQLMRQADLAMYSAKGAGGGYRVFKSHMTTQIERRLLIENDLREAINHQALQVYYQPKLRATDGHVMGMEALIRWNHPELGWVPPTELVAIAEETGMIGDITQLVLKTAMKQQAVWSEQGCPVTVAINVSPAEFRRDDLVDSVRTALLTTGADPHFVELEITESMLMNDTGSVHSTLGSLKSLGVKLVIDDFGSGYSNLGYLQKFPLDSIKIDQSFLNDGEISPVVKLILEVGKTLSLTVVAEGVENIAQRDFLIGHGCDQLQGFLFSCAMDSPGATQFLMAYKGEFDAWPKKALLAI